MDKSDWDAVYRRLLEQGRARIDPPTAEEVEALFDGSLSNEDADRVRSQLVYYPEMTRVMTQAPPPEDVEVLSDEERAADWEAVMKRVKAPVPFRPRRAPRVFAWAAAAALALLLGGAIVYFQSKVPVKTPQIAKRIERRELRPDAQTRGTATLPPVTLAIADEYVLQPLTSRIAHDDDYRIDIVDLDANRVIWTRTGLSESPNGAFEITVSNNVLKPGGRYRLVLYGISAGAPHRMEAYTVRVAKT